IQRQRSPERIAPEKPRESRPLALSRSTVPSDKPGAQKWIRHHSLQHAYARPIVSPLNLLIRQIQRDRLRQKSSVILRRFLQQIRVVRRQMAIGFRSEEHTSELQSHVN